MFRHIGIVTQDIDKMLFFYKNILELDVVSDEIESGVFLNEILGYETLEVRIVKLGKNKQTIIELLDFNKKGIKTESSLLNFGYTHFALTINNIDRLYEKLKELEIEVISSPQISVNKKFKVCFCKDYENNFIELVEIL